MDYLRNRPRPHSSGTIISEETTGSAIGGAIIGGLIAGPSGAVIGGIIGVWLGTERERQKKW